MSTNHHPPTLPLPHPFICLSAGLHKYRGITLNVTVFQKVLKPNTFNCPPSDHGLPKDFLQNLIDCLMKVIPDTKALVCFPFRNFVNYIAYRKTILEQKIPKAFSCSKPHHM